MVREDIPIPKDLEVFFLLNRTTAEEVRSHMPHATCHSHTHTHTQPLILTHKPAAAAAACLCLTPNYFTHSLFLSLFLSHTLFFSFCFSIHPFISLSVFFSPPVFPLYLSLSRTYKSALPKHTHTHTH